MSTPSTETSYFENLYRFALILTGNAEAAERHALSSLEEVAQLKHLGDEEHTWRLLYANLRKRASKEAALADPLSEKISALHKLDEPGRSALTLLYLGDVAPETAHRVLEISEKEFVQAVQKARESLDKQLPPTDSEKHE